MSTMKVDNIAPSAGGTSTDLMGGLVKAWANLNGAGTIAFRGSFNLSSATDLGTGYYQFNFTNNMNAADYYANGNGGGITGPATNNTGSAGLLTASSVNIKVCDAAGTVIDRDMCVVDVLGDLA